MQPAGLHRAGPLGLEHPRLPRGRDPAAGGISTATALARLYGCLALGGQTLLRPETVELGRTQLSSGTEALGDWLSAFGVGFMLPTPDDHVYDPRAFGHDGIGGQTSGAWPGQGVGFAYLTTAQRSGPLADGRVSTLLSALRDALDGAAGRSMVDSAGSPAVEW